AEPSQGVGGGRNEEPFRFPALAENYDLERRALSIRPLRKGLTRSAFKRRPNAVMNAAHRVLDPASPGALPEGLCALAVMTKAPRPGAVKTRLTPPLSPEEAAALNTCFLQDTTAALLKTAELGTAR